MAGMFDDLIAQVQPSQDSGPAPAAPAAPASSASASPGVDPKQGFPMFADLAASSGASAPTEDYAPGERPLTVHARQKASPEIEVDAKDPEGIKRAIQTLDPANAPGAGASAGLGALQGASMGFGDENRGLAAASGMSSLIPGANIVGGIRMGAEALAPSVFGHGATDRYNQQVSQARADNAIAEEKNPGSYFAGEMVGGLATLPVAPELAPFKAAEGAGLASRVAAGAGNLAANGAAFGAVAGAGEAEGGVADRLSGAAKGAATGAVFNPAIGGAVNGLLGAGGAAAKFVQRDAMARFNPQALADETIARRMEMDGVTPDSLMEGMTDAPAPVMVNPQPGNATFEPYAATPQGPRAPNGLLTAADVAGPNLQGLAGSIVRGQGKGQTSARDMLNARQFGDDVTPAQGDRVQSAVTDMMGGKDLASDAIEQITAHRKAQADPAYTAAFERSVPMNDTLADLLNRPSVKAAIPAAARKLADDMPGESLFANQGSQWERDAMGGGPVGEPDRPFAPLHDGSEFVPVIKPAAPRPQTLLNFLQRTGVHDAGGDLRSMGYDRYPGLIRNEGGVSLDKAREAAAEAGYLGADTDRAMAETTVNDLLEALENPNHTSIFDDHAAYDWSQYDQARATNDQMGRPESKATAPPRAPQSVQGDAGQPDSTPPEVTTRGWHYIKRALDDKISGARKAGSADDVRIFGGLKQVLLNEVEKANPAYGTARKFYAGDSELIDAVKDGQAAFKPTTSVDAIKKTLAGYKSEAERESYRMSAAKALKDHVATIPDKTDKVAAISGSPALRAKLDLIAPDAAAKLRIMGFVRNERSMTTLRQNAAGGSPTAAKLSDDNAFTEKLDRAKEGLHLAHSAMTLNVPAAFGSVIRILSKISPELRSGVLEEARKVILNPDPNALRMFQERIERRGVEAGPRRELSETLSRLVNSSRTGLVRAVVLDSSIPQRGTQFAAPVGRHSYRPTH